MPRRRGGERLWSIESQRFRGWEPLNVCHEGLGAKLLYMLSLLLAARSIRLWSVEITARMPRHGPSSETIVQRVQISTINGLLRAIAEAHRYRSVE